MTFTVPVNGRVLAGAVEEAEKANLIPYLRVKYTACPALLSVPCFCG